MELRNSSLAWTNIPSSATRTAQLTFPNIWQVCKLTKTSCLPGQGSPKICEISVLFFLLSPGLNFTYVNKILLTLNDPDSDLNCNFPSSYFFRGT